MWVAGLNTEARKRFERVLLSDPANVAARYNLAMLSSASGDSEAAIRIVREAVQLEPKNAVLKVFLARLLRDRGAIDEAESLVDRAVDLDPANGEARIVLAAILIERGRLEDGLEQWQAGLLSQSDRHDDWYGYAELALYLGDEAAYDAARVGLLKRFSETRDPFVAQRVARACLLRPASEEQLITIDELCDRAISGAPSNLPAARPHFEFAKALCDLRRGRPGASLARLDGDVRAALPVASGLLRSIALRHLGRDAEAAAELRDAVGGARWDAPSARDLDTWILHLLRREAEAGLPKQ
jgi:tetratricopeptide (TPR) repeat protein